MPGWSATASGTCWRRGGPEHSASVCCLGVTGGRNWSGPARIASMPTQPNCSPGPTNSASATSGPEAGGSQDRAGDHAVTGEVRVLIRAARTGRALPRPLADPGHVAWHRADTGEGHGVAEVGGVERAEYVRYLHPGLP